MGSYVVRKDACSIVWGSGARGPCRYERQKRKRPLGLARETAGQQTWAYWIWVSFGPAGYKGQADLGL